MRLDWMAITLSLTFMTPTFAQTVEHHHVFIFGDGLVSCSEFLQKAETEHVQNSSIGDSTDTLGRMAWIENYCRTYPREKFFNALLSFRNFLKDQREFPKNQSK